MIEDIEKVNQSNLIDMEKFKSIKIYDATKIYGYCFFDIRQSFYESINNLGISTIMIEKSHFEEYGPHDTENLYLIFGSHILNFEKTKFPKYYVPYQLEQLMNTKLFNRNYLEILSNAYQIWDYSLKNIEFLRNQTKIPESLPILYVPVGYSPCLEFSTKNHISMEKKPKNVVFYGTLSPRRKGIIEYLGNSEIHITTYENNCWGDYRNKIINDAAIVLNIHCFDGSLMELARLSLLLSNGVLVISELGEEANINDKLKNCLVLVNNKEEMAEKIKYYLNHPGEGELIANNGYNIFKNEFNLSKILPITNYRKPENDNDNNNLKFLFGTDNHQIDITKEFVVFLDNNKTYDHNKQKFFIPKGTRFINLFGDPCPNEVKKITIWDNNVTETRLLGNIQEYECVDFSKKLVFLSDENGNYKLKKTLKMYLLCPIFSSGGPENIHLLCSHINENYNPDVVKCYIHYIPNEQKKYENIYPDIKYIKVAKNIDDNPHSILIIPEIYNVNTYKSKYPNSIIAVWWLSYTNACRHGKLEMNLIPNIIHLFHSYFEYAMIRPLISPSVENYFLTDHINPDYLELNTDDFYSTKKNIVCFGFKDELTETVCQKMNIPYIAIKNMTKDKVMETLKSSKVYVDLGFHPGKDHLPREAALCGCVVITNKCGSAAYFEDVPIEEKITYYEDIYTLIPWALENYSELYKKQESYRQIIRKEKKHHDENIQKFIESIKKKLIT